LIEYSKNGKVKVPEGLIHPSSNSSQIVLDPIPKKLSRLTLQAMDRLDEPL